MPSIVPGHLLGILLPRPPLPPGSLHRSLPSLSLQSGSLRRIEVAIVGSSWTPSPAVFVKEELEELIRWYLENERLLHPFELAAIFNHRFLQIHPFADGNGRVARELFNFILMRNGFPPVITPVSKKEEYMRSLEEADRGNIAFFIEFMALRMIDDYSRVLCSVLELSRDDVRELNPEERKELLDLSSWFLGLTSEYTREVPARAKGAIGEIFAGWCRQMRPDLELNLSDNKA